MVEWRHMASKIVVAITSGNCLASNQMNSDKNMQRNFNENTLYIQQMRIKMTSAISFRTRCVSILILMLYLALG